MSRSGSLVTEWHCSGVGGVSVWPLYVLKKRKRSVVDEARRAPMGAP